MIVFFCLFLLFVAQLVLQSPNVHSISPNRRATFSSTYWSSVIDFIKILSTLESNGNARVHMIFLILLALKINKPTFCRSGHENRIRHLSGFSPCSLNLVRLFVQGWHLSCLIAAFVFLRQHLSAQHAAAAAATTTAASEESASLFWLLLVFFQTIVTGFVAKLVSLFVWLWDVRSTWIS